VVTSFSDSDGVDIVVVAAVVVIALMSSLLSIVVIEDDVVDEEEPNVSSSSGGNVGKEIDTLEPFEAFDSSSSSSKGDLPSTLVPSSLLWTPVLPPPPPPAPPRILRRTIGPRTRMTSATIALTFASIL